MSSKLFNWGVLPFLVIENTTPILENNSSIQNCMSGFPENGITGQGLNINQYLYT